MFVDFYSCSCNVVILLLKFVYSEKATKFCEISTLLLSTVHTNKSKVEISQNFVAFSEYIIFPSILYESTLQQPYLKSQDTFVLS